MPPAEEEEDESILGDLDLTHPTASILLAGLSEEEQLALAVNASMHPIRGERAARVASFIYDRTRYLFCSFFSVFHTLYSEFEYHHLNVRIPVILAARYYQGKPWCGQGCGGGYGGLGSDFRDFK